jgi:hypothetical protein
LDCLYENKSWWKSSALLFYKIKTKNTPSFQSFLDKVIFYFLPI